MPDLATHTQPGDARASHARRPVSTWLLNAVLSDDPKQRVRIGRSLLATFVYAVGWGLCEFGLRRWQLSHAGVRVYEITSLLIALSYYGALRSGWNRRFQDPSLTGSQIVAAQFSGALFYAVMSPVRGAMLSLQVIILFFAMFKLKLRGQLFVSVNALLVMGVTTTMLGILWPQTYDPTTELVHFIVLLTILPPVSLLGAQLTSMRAKLHQQKDDLILALAHIKTLADRDELTGLLNRRCMRDMIMHHVKLQSRNGSGCSLALIDLDHFKRINDSHGHAVGDDVLCLFSQEVRKVLRETDLVARWGGEEFLVLLTGTRVDEAVTAMERVRDGLAQAAGPQQAPSLRVQFSAGVAELMPLEAMDKAIERADEALYRAKALGRNRTELALEPALTGGPSDAVNVSSAS
ncbi:MAG: GGDEF domain-containing protein [Aquabacterium sp.]|uniref:GGDEF domain-containing protein n=1 Tax=Aquabacterium sp. TaxID=1872578 RepID=UPI0025C25BF5|nr:GGDEF domain-containing protein [Aquabacterium sp.]MBI5924594.1 GGDEF domain-containing protein [Aquabacterium sp.]